MRKARLFAPGASRTRPIAGMRSGRWATHFLKINHAPLIEHEQSPARRPDFSFVARHGSGRGAAALAVCRADAEAPVAGAMKFRRSADGESRPGPVGVSR